MRGNYIEQYTKLYEIKESYGQTSIKLYDLIIPYIDQYKPGSILDFGCGKSNLIECISREKNILGYRFDPAIRIYSEFPSEKVDFIICTDVLQHVPLYDLDRVLEKIKKCTSNCFFYIKCAQHNTILPNGELANCTVYPADWWECKLGEFFDYVKKIIVPDETSIAFITE